MGGFDGSTFGAAGAIQDTSIICGIPGSSVPCPADNGPVVDKQGSHPYIPVDSEFGYYVVDFLGAVGKVRDGDYKEGFVNDFTDDNGSTGRYQGRQCSNFTLQGKATARHMVSGPGWHIGKM